MTYKQNKICIPIIKTSDKNRNKEIVIGWIKVNVKNDS